MKCKNSLYLGLSLLLILSCSSNELYPDQFGVQGTWRLYEEGSSPGFGYVITPVPEKPLQALTLTNRGELRKEGDRLNSFFRLPYYRVDLTKGVYRIAFLENRKDSSRHFAGLLIKGDTMRITPVCYEGCHFSFVRVR